MPTRRPFVAGNWKMNTDRASALKLAFEVCQGVAPMTPGGGGGAVEVAVCPPLVYLDAVGQTLRTARSAVGLGAQDVHHERSGAFTGEVSPAMLADLGVRCVLTGHSERRHALGESDETVRRKTAAVLEAGLCCILCVGETLDQRRAGRTNAVNERQVRTALAGIGPEQLRSLTIAYEPVWAIGTGQTPTPGDAQEAHAAIRSVVAALAGEALGSLVRILYGGSVKPDNARELFSQPDIDGGLIGGASLSAESFIAIVNAAR